MEDELDCNYCSQVDAHLFDHAFKCQFLQPYPMVNIALFKVTKVWKQQKLIPFPKTPLAILTGQLRSGKTGGVIGERHFIYIYFIHLLFIFELPPLVKKLSTSAKKLST